jgi:hypothetical protein
VNVKHKRYERKTHDLLIAFIGYVNDLNKLRQFKVKCYKIPLSTLMRFSILLTIVLVRVALLSRLGVLALGGQQS